MNIKKTKMESTFDIVADNYGAGSDFFSSLAKDLVEWAQIESGKTVLDFGAGDGAVLHRLLEVTKNNGNFSAIDMSSSMIERLKQSLSPKQKEVVECQVMDGEELKFANNMFDVVLSGAVMHLLSNQEKGLREIFRVLNPNGYLAFNVPGNKLSGKWSFYPELFSKYVVKIDPAVWQSSMPKENDYELIMKNIGFKKIQSAHRDTSTTFKDSHAFWDWQMNHSRRGFIDALNEDDRTDYKKELFAALDDVTTKQGITMTRDTLYFKGYKPE